MGRFGSYGLWLGFWWWSLLLVRVAALDHIRVRVGCGWVRVGRLGDWGGLLLGFCGWWLVVGLWRW